MASNFCCIAEQEGRPDSPELPNARLNGTTPAKQPLLPKLPGSSNSRFTSFRSDELHELHQIFDRAQDGADDNTTPARASRARFSRASVYSLHSLHKMTSMRSLIRRRFSRDLTKKESAFEIHTEATESVITSDHDTVVKISKIEATQQLQITKHDLRKDLLSDKKPDQGGYDSDAEILGVLARNAGKKTPSKRASIHTVRWSPSTGSKSTPESSTKSRTDGERGRHEIPPYQIQKPPAVSLATRVGHVFSTPNLRVDVSGGRNCAFRRSQSATSIGLPQVLPLSPLSPLRLPSLTDHDQNGIPWAETINESLRLSQFPPPPDHLSPRGSQTLPLPDEAVKTTQCGSQKSSPDEGDPIQRPSKLATAAAQPVGIHIQPPTSMASPRPINFVRGTLQTNAQPLYVEEANEKECEKEDNSRHSVHLYSMRISHHLRSGSLLSWEQLADAPVLPSPTQTCHDRTTSDQSGMSQMSRQIIRHERQTSSSEFASSQVPSRWGKVLLGDHDVRSDMASSIYSSRPQSPPDSFVASLTSLGQVGTAYDNSTGKPIHLPRIRRSNSPPTDNEETPRAAPRYGSSNLRSVQGAPLTESLSGTPVSLARKNSVADTKKSKFREEFSPSPPRRRIAPSESIVKFLNLKRLSGRSQSAASLIPEPLIQRGDATFDELDVPTSRERRQSQSMMSLQAEQSASCKFKGPNHVWDQALKAHQEEKASLFLPINRDLAARASPFRERSGSVMTRHSANESSAPVTSDPRTVSGNLFTPSYSPSPIPNLYTDDELCHSRFVSRRSAITDVKAGSVDREVSVIFEKQGDNPDIVGAWGRYPSHTREDRANSASKSDRVASRDFALEAAIKFASAQYVDEDMIDPTERIPSTPLTPGDKRRKKKVGGERMAKSNSMTFGKMFMKNYSNIFKSSSLEFRKHGRNHRSSIATGGVLEFPELELLPEVGKQGYSVDGSSYGSLGRHHSTTRRRRTSDGHPANELQMLDSSTTLRPRRNSSAPNLNLLTYDGTNEDQQGKDNARVWSIYYDDCVPSYPRASIDSFGPARFAFESRNPSLRSRTMLGRSTKHSRDNSRLSYASFVSRGSARPYAKPQEEDDDFAEKKSVVSVRHSTMDLISKFKEQEIAEHERVLSMGRPGSRYGSGALAAL
ncbi:hypothetical protein C7974DRAFT_129392 [Boeremia exigua]|uniref:uncharacterized protein n=1 Tax=Boeremia exigua TaxID=749465 RepID=UPI001E8E8E16|nr:uncharacterized protein C7974DRAFT_129392 [Boeremia exigua]KAH6639340.1 hypothetical protein C7974DRAFT_129392 [Boeremia exigua]